MNLARQGDVLIKPVDSISSTAKKIKGNIVVRGEATGHSHRLIGGDILADKNMLYLIVKNKARLVHQEHKPISLGKGKYVVIRQKEYQNKDMVRLVTD